MGKFAIFAVLWYILGNPILALLVLLAVLYLLDRRYVGLLPNVFRPLAVRRNIARLRNAIRINPHDTASRHELARRQMEAGRYRDALDTLRAIRPVLHDSDDLLAEIGICCLKLNSLEEGERHILEAFERNPRVMYGEPYLHLGEAFAKTDPDKAVQYLERYREAQSSSCKGLYRLGQLYDRLGRKTDATEAFREASALYRALPRYRRKTERRWHILSNWKLLLRGG